MDELIRTTLLPCIFTIRRRIIRLLGLVRRSIRAQCLVAARRITNAAVDTGAKVEILAIYSCLAELNAVAINALLAGAAARDVESAGAGGDAADPPCHAGGVEDGIDLVAWALRVVAFEGNRLLGF
jgi:hypothetical protein